MSDSTVLAGHTALVTGANGGLGSHFALTLARAGAAVALAARRPGSVDAVAREIEQANGRALALALDVTRPGDAQRAIDEAAAGLGPVTIVVNNAGIAITKPLLDHTEDDWRQVVGVNLDGAWRVAQAVARRLKEAERPGTIVNIASVLADRVAAQVAPYTVSKAALVQLTRAMALELARYGIRVNALAPGYVETPINRDFFATEGGRALVKRIPQRRLGRVEDLEAPLILLASDASTYMTGAVIAVDGGHAVSSL